MNPCRSEGCDEQVFESPSDTVGVQLPRDTYKTFACLAARSQVAIAAVLFAAEYCSSVTGSSHVVASRPGVSSRIT